MTTVSDGQEVREAGKEVEATALPEALRRPARTCASMLPLPSATALAPITERARSAGATAVVYGAKAAELLDRPGSLIHAQPPSFARARELHHERARRYETRAVRHLFIVYGYLHLIFVKPVLNALEWVTETPLRALGALVLILIIWLWS